MLFIFLDPWDTHQFLQEGGVWSYSWYYLVFLIPQIIFFDPYSYYFLIPDPTLNRYVPKFSEY